MSVVGCATSSRITVFAVVPRTVPNDGPAPSATEVVGAKAVSADELYTVYSQNLIIRANPDQRFIDRWLIVTGVVSGVSRSVPPHVYLELGTHDPEGFVYAEPATKAAPLLLMLRPGMSVRLLCLGSGMMIGSPLLRACRPTEALGVPEDLFR